MPHIHLNIGKALSRALTISRHDRQKLESVLAQAIADVNGAVQRGADAAVRTAVELAIEALKKAVAQLPKEEKQP